MKTLVKPLCLLVTLFPMHLALGESEWLALFNRRNLDGWTERNQSGSFRVEDGTIIGTAKEGLGSTFLCTDEELSDFKLEFETALIDPELNSGVQIRSNNRELKGKQKVADVAKEEVLRISTMPPGLERTLTLS